MNLFLLGLILGIALTGIITFFVHHHTVKRERTHAADAERRAAEAEHLAELGTMTGGLAHEIKNPLSTIGLNTELLNEDIEDLSNIPDDERSRLTNRMTILRREIDRLRGILDDFLQFAGRMHLDPEVHDLNRIIEELVDFYHPQAGRAGVRMHAHIADQPVYILADSHLFKQAILNLLINATQALEGLSSPDRLKELMLRVEVEQGSDDSPGPVAVLHITDTGPGISAEDIKRIFHPYFSTKKGGTGLGLPTTRRIVNAHGGQLEVHAEKNRGTDFAIRLPICDEPALSSGSRS